MSRRLPSDLPMARRVICSGNGPNGRLNALGREAVLLRWPALLARVGVPARIEEPPPLSPHRWRARSSGARPPVHPSKSAYLLTWPQKGGVAYAPTSDFPPLPRTLLVICLSEFSLRELGLPGWSQGRGVLGPDPSRALSIRAFMHARIAASPGVVYLSFVAVRLV